MLNSEISKDKTIRKGKPFYLDEKNQSVLKSHQFSTILFSQTSNTLNCINCGSFLGGLDTQVKWFHEFSLSRNQSLFRRQFCTELRTRPFPFTKTKLDPKIHGSTTQTLCPLYFCPQDGCLDAYCSSACREIDFLNGHHWVCCGRSYTHSIGLRRFVDRTVQDPTLANCSSLPILPLEQTFLALKIIGKLINLSSPSDSSSLLTRLENFLHLYPPPSIFPQTFLEGLDQNTQDSFEPSSLISTLEAYREGYQLLGILLSFEKGLARLSASSNPSHPSHPSHPSESAEVSPSFPFGSQLLSQLPSLLPFSIWLQLLFSLHTHTLSLSLDSPFSSLAQSLPNLPTWGERRWVLERYFLPFVNGECVLAKEKGEQLGPTHTINNRNRSRKLFDPSFRLPPHVLESDSGELYLSSPFPDDPSNPSTASTSPTCSSLSLSSLLLPAERLMIRLAQASSLSGEPESSEVSGSRSVQNKEEEIFGTKTFNHLKNKKKSNQNQSTEGGGIGWSEEESREGGFASEVPFNPFSSLTFSCQALVPLISDWRVFPHSCSPSLGLALDPHQNTHPTSPSPFYPPTLPIQFVALKDLQIRSISTTCTPSTIHTPLTLSRIPHPGLPPDSRSELLRDRLLSSSSHNPSLLTPQIPSICVCARCCFERDLLETDQKINNENEIGCGCGWGWEDALQCGLNQISEDSLPLAISTLTFLTTTLSTASIHPSLKNSPSSSPYSSHLSHSTPLLSKQPPPPKNLPQLLYLLSFSFHALGAALLESGDWRVAHQTWREGWHLTRSLLENIESLSLPSQSLSSQSVSSHDLHSDLDKPDNKEARFDNHTSRDTDEAMVKSDVPSSIQSECPSLSSTHLQAIRNLLSESNLELESNSVESKDQNQNRVQRDLKRKYQPTSRPLPSSQSSISPTSFPPNLIGSSWDEWPWEEGARALQREVKKLDSYPQLDGSLPLNAPTDMTIEATPSLPTTRSLSLESLPSPESIRSDCLLTRPPFGSAHLTSPILSLDQCAAIIDLAEKHARNQSKSTPLTQSTPQIPAQDSISTENQGQDSIRPEVGSEGSEGWQTSRHYGAPTVDIPVNSCPELLAYFSSLLTHTLAPILARQFLDPRSLSAPSSSLHCEPLSSSPSSSSLSYSIRVHDAFVVKYRHYEPETETRNENKSESEKEAQVEGEVSFGPSLKGHWFDQSIYPSESSLPPSPTTTTPSHPQDPTLPSTSSLKHPSPLPSPSDQRFLSLHTDQSTHSFTIALNPSAQHRRDHHHQHSTVSLEGQQPVIDSWRWEGEEYEGGGTYFADLKDFIKPDQGCMLSFSGGRLVHGGDPLLRGTRYILTAFLLIERTDSISPSHSLSSLPSSPTPNKIVKMKDKDDDKSHPKASSSSASTSSFTSHNEKKDSGTGTDFSFGFF